jgi:hypothetical protein
MPADQETESNEVIERLEDCVTCWIVGETMVGQFSRQQWSAGRISRRRPIMERRGLPRIGSGSLGAAVVVPKCKRW